MREDSTRGPNADQSGWVTTRVAARSLRVDPRTVRKYIKQGKLVAKSEGEGVEKTYLVSVDSLHELLGSRPNPRVDRDEVPPESAGSATTADLVNLVRDLSGEVTRRASEAAELRTRLELTERAESSQREALEQRLETERLLKEQAERERNELRRQLEGLHEAPDGPESGLQSIEGVDTPTNPGDQETPQETKRQGPGSTGPPKYGESAIPRRTIFAWLVPLPREYKREGDTEIYTENTLTRKKIIERYGSYGIGIVLLLAASFYTAPESSPINMLPLAFSAAFGFYIGIKDGRVPVWGRFNLLGALCGILVTWSTWKSYYEPWGHIPETEAVVTSFFGIWLIFISGVLLGKVVQFKAEQERWGTQSGITFGNERGGTTDQWSPRTAAILGLIGVLGAALLQVIGQVISALLGNGT